MDDKIHIPKEESEKLEPSFDQLSEERNLRKQAEEKLKTIQAELNDRNLELEQLRLVKGSQDAILNTE